MYHVTGHFFIVKKDLFKKFTMVARIGDRQFPKLFLQYYLIHFLYVKISCGYETRFFIDRLSVLRHTGTSLAKSKLGIFSDFQKINFTYYTYMHDSNLQKDNDYCKHRFTTIRA